MDILWLLCFALALTAGQLLFKHAALAIAAAGDRGAFDAALSTPSLWAALALYGLTTLLWVWILTRIPLTRAYPFTAVAVILVPLAASLLFGERPRPPFWLGVGLVAAGVVIAQHYAS